MYRTNIQMDKWAEPCEASQITTQLKLQKSHQDVFNPVKRSILNVYADADTSM